MKGTVTAIRSGFPSVRGEDGIIREGVDFFHGQLIEIGDIVMFEDCSSLPEDPEHFLIEYVIDAKRDRE